MIKKILYISLTILLFNFTVKAQNVECIDNLINIPLAGYKAGNIQWQLSTDQTNWIDIENQNSASLSYHIQETGYFRAEIIDLACTYYSDTVFIQAFPYPTVANAGPDQSYDDSTTSVILAGNVPEAGYGTGYWSIVSGEGGSFVDSTDAGTVFSGNHCTDYTLSWTITTPCSTSSDDVFISFNQVPTIANAGLDQSYVDGTTLITLAANEPEAGHGTGLWSILSGEGGSFDDATNPYAVFTGQVRGNHELQWSITTNCDVSNDIVKVSFFQDEAGETITDVEGNSYNTVWIGSQLWMAENLRYLPSVVGHITGSHTTPYYYVNGYDGTVVGDARATTNYQTYGVLYNWPAAMNVCPDGWHLPSDAEWTELENYLADNGYNYDGTTGGGRDKIAKAMATTSGWDSSSETGVIGNNDYPEKRNASGFSGFPGGFRFGHLIGDPVFAPVGNIGYWWSATEDGSEAWGRSLRYDNSNMGRNYEHGKDLGFSVRCLRD